MNFKIFLAKKLVNPLFQVVYLKKLTKTSTPKIKKHNEYQETENTGQSGKP